LGLDERARRLARKFCVEEYKDYLVYSYLASRERDPRVREVLEGLARQELEHYKFWRGLVSECDARVARAYLAVVGIMRRLLGATFTLRWLERHEEEVIAEYRRFLGNLEGAERERLEEIIREEEEHEEKLLSSIDERIVKYIGFIALGLADAIVEITGVHAGVLGASQSTLYAGVTGLIVGFSAAISMASAAYLQAKQEVGRNPVSSALVTGSAYIAAVVLLAIPYFLTHSMIVAFTASVLLGVALIAFFTYYSSVIGGRPFLREFLESTALMLGTAFGSYLFGEALGRYFGIRVEG